MIGTQNIVDIIPLPFFKVFRDGAIAEASGPTFNIFPKSTNFLDLVDLGSRKKARTFIFNSQDFPVRLELNMATIGESAHLFDVVADLDSTEDVIHIICLSKGNYESMVKQRIATLEKRTGELGELLHSRDTELEETLNAMKDLSLKYDNLSSVRKLAASVAHEIRNPLTTVRGFMQLMKPYLEGTGKESYADVAIEEIDRANKIIYEFLNASKTQTPKKEVTSIHNVIEDIVLLCQSEAVLNNVELHYVESTYDFKVRMDSKQIKQVLLNLIQNALQAIDMARLKTTGQILIRTSLNFSKEVLIEIKDNGIGMEQAVLDNLFKPFFTTKEDGNGIGLAVCSEIIKDHNGDIQVESDVGKGSIFKIMLPTCKG